MGRALTPGLIGAGAIAEVSPTRFGQEMGVQGWKDQTAVFCVLAIVLLLGVLGLLCWWRPLRRGGQAALNSEQQVGSLSKFIFSAALVPLGIWGAWNRRVMALLSRTSRARWRGRGLCSHYQETREPPPNQTLRAGNVAKQNGGCSAHLLWAPFFWEPPQPFPAPQAPLELAWGLPPTREAALPLRCTASPGRRGKGLACQLRRVLRPTRVVRISREKGLMFQLLGKNLLGRGRTEPQGHLHSALWPSCYVPPPPAPHSSPSLMLQPSHSGANSGSPFQEWMLQRPRGAPTYSPRTEAAPGSDWGA